MTPKEWYTKTIGRKIDCDNFPKGDEYQCWDYFKYFCNQEDLRYMNCHCSISGYAGDIWHLRFKNGASSYFKFIYDVNALQDGDWCFWDRHVAFRYNGKEVGQNQYGKKYVTSIPFEKQGFIGAFRYKYWSKEDKGVAEKFDSKYNNAYRTTAPLNLRTGGSVEYPIILTLPEDYPVRCYGYYHDENGVPWLYVCTTVNFISRVGFVCSKYLRKE